MIAQDYTDTIDAHGILVEVPSRYAPEEEETESEPVYQPAPTCEQCEHFYQSKHPKAEGSTWGYCPVLDAERRMSYSLADSTPKIIPSKLTRCPVPSPGLFDIPSTNEKKRQSNDKTSKSNL